MGTLERINEVRRLGAANGNENADANFVELADDASMPWDDFPVTYATFPNGIAFAGEFRSALGDRRTRLRSTWLPAEDPMHEAWVQAYEDGYDPGSFLVDHFGPNDSIRLDRSGRIGCSGGLFLWHEPAPGEGAWVFLSSRLGFAQEYFSYSAELGTPTYRATELGGWGRPATAEKPAIQRFENGLVTWHPDFGFFKVVGEVFEVYESRLGELWLGAAKTDVVEIGIGIERDQDSVQVNGVAQYFEKGQINRTDEGQIVASAGGRLLLDYGSDRWPHAQIETVIETVIVHEESGNDRFAFWNVKDEVRASISHSYGTGTTRQNQITRFAIAADDNRSYAIGKRVYGGPLPAAANLTLLSVEEDSVDVARKTLAAFESAVTTDPPLDGDLKDLADRLARLHPNLTLSDFSETIRDWTSAGAIAGIVATATSVTLYASGVAVGTAVGVAGGFTINGGLFGGVIGAVIGAAVGLILAGIQVAVANSDPPDPLALSTIQMSGSELLNAFDTKVPPHGTTFAPVSITDYRIKGTREFRFDGDDLIESQRFRTTEDGDLFADYEIVFRHREL